MSVRRPSLPVLPASAAPEVQVPVQLQMQVQVDDCWNRIGVRGDRTCPELVTAIHCRNCAVFGAAGRRLLDRSPPQGYLDEWTHRLAEPARDTRTPDHSVVIFRLGVEWLALETRYFVETTQPRTVRRVPHSRSPAFRGLVNIRGRLELCVALEAILHPAAGPAAGGTGARLLVVEHEKRAWVFAADEVHGVQHFAAADVAPVPATVQRGPASHTRGLLRWGDRRVGYIDAERLFRTLEASIG